MSGQPGASVIVPARIEDVPRFIALRGQTRENAVSEARLASLGITAQSWAADMREGRLQGFQAEEPLDGGGALAGEATAGEGGLAGPADGSRATRLLGYCFGDPRTGEIVVLALLPEAEGRGLGKRLLDQVVQALAALGHRRLFLGTSPDPRVRSHGFYRHLGWQPTGERDGLNDEVLALTLPVPAAQVPERHPG